MSYCGVTHGPTTLGLKITALAVLAFALSSWVQPGRSHAVVGQPWLGSEAFPGRCRRDFRNEPREERGRHSGSTSLPRSVSAGDPGPGQPCAGAGE